MRSIEKLKQLKKYKLANNFKATIYTSESLSHNKTNKLFIQTLIVTYDNNLKTNEIDLNIVFNKQISKEVYQIKVCKTKYNAINIKDSLLMDYGRLEELLRILQ